jgi:tripartite-type tricarboxylate transporter receptor subunit TctC
MAVGKTTRIVVPFPPGGTADVIARQIAQQAQQASGQSIVIENRPGAGTIIATDLVNRAAPDGTTLLLMASSFVINPSLRASLPYHPLAFEPICLLVNSPQVVVVNSASPYQSLGETLRRRESAARRTLLRDRGSGDDAAYRRRSAAPRRRSQSHLRAVSRRRAGGERAARRPCCGGADQLLRSDGAGDAGKLRALAVTTSERIPPLPNVPTLAEAGHKDLEATAWFGMMAPPKDITTQLIATFKAALQPEVSAKLTAQGLYPVGACGPDFAEHVRKQHETYARAVRELNIKGE